MKSKVYIFLMVALSSAAMADDDIKEKCSSSAKLLVEASWNAYPRDTRNRNGDPEKSISLLKKALNDSPDCQWALRHISGMYDEILDYKTALVYNEKLLKLYPDDLTAKVDKSNLLVHTGRPKEAIRILEEIIDEHGPGNGSWHYSLASIYAYQNNITKALDVLEDVAKINKAWLNESNAQANKTFKEVVKHERFKRLLAD